MCSGIDDRFIVYSFPDKKVRGLNLNNYNDDFNCGILFFTRDALNALTKNGIIIGFYYFDEDNISHPIDIFSNKIGIFEGEFNCFNDNLKKILLAFNIENHDDLLSEFMFKWQFLNVYKNDGATHFIRVVSHIIGDHFLLNKCLEDKINIYLPKSYIELCEAVKKLIKLFKLDYKNMDFVEEYKQLLYSFENNILINFTEDEIWIYFQNFCSVLLKNIGVNNE